MLEPRFTEGDVVDFRVEVLGLRSKDATTDTIVCGPYRNGIWWEYETSTGWLVRDHEIERLVGRSPYVEIPFDSGV